MVICNVVGITIQPFQCSNGQMLEMLETPRDPLACGHHNLKHFKLRAAILDPDFPTKASKVENYKAPALPVTVQWLKDSGLSEKFIAYMRTWEGFAV